MIEAEVRQQIDKRLIAQGWVLDPESPDRNVFIERSVVPRLGAVQRSRLSNLAPDYTFLSDGSPVAVLEAKKPQVSIYQAIEQGADYAERLGVDYVFACNGPMFKSFHVPTGRSMSLNNVEVMEPLSPAQLRRFKQESTDSVITVPKRVINSRSQLIEVFENLNNFLRQAGIRAGLDRFTEFANILFLKLLSERDQSDQTWQDLLAKNDDDLPEYINSFVVNKLRRKYDSDVLSKTQINGGALKKIIMELNPLHLMSVDEDLKGVAFEHFLSRTTATNNDLGEYFTPRSVVRFMVQLLNPQFGKTVYDPFCGTGGFLIEAFRHLSQQIRYSDESIRVLHHESIYGQELTTTARVAKMNMILFGDGHSGVERDDSLAPPPPGPPRSFDCVLSNIPFSLKNIGAEKLRLVDQRAETADEACLLRCFNSVKLGGSMAVVLPEGLVVNRRHRQLWESIFDRCRVRVIASLPRGTFAPYTEACTRILFLTDKETQSTEWHYRVRLSADEPSQSTISTDEFLFFFQDTEIPLEELPAGVEVERRKAGRGQWIPQGTNVLRLDQVATIRNGKNLTKAEANDGKIPVIAGGKGSIACWHNASNTDGNCCTISKSGAYAGFAWWHEDPIWASDCLVIRSQDEGRFLSFFLYMCLATRQDEIYERQQGTGQPHIYQEHIQEFPIPNVSLEIQKRLTSKAREAIQKRIQSEQVEKNAYQASVDAISSLARRI